MQVFKILIFWLAFILASFLPTSALTVTAPENLVLEIFSIGYDAPIAEVNDLGSDAETSTSNYDTAPIHSAASEKIPTEANRALFGQNAEFKAAEEGLTALERRQIEQIADKYDTTIDVVGSRASGGYHNIETDLPIGHDRVLERSDIDFRIDTSHPAAQDIIDELNGVGNGAGSADMRFDISGSRGPVIRITPAPKE